MGVIFHFEAVGSMLDEDIYSPSGLLLLRKGIRLTERHIIILQTHFENSKVSELLHLPAQPQEIREDCRKETVAKTIYMEGIQKFYELMKKPITPSIEELKQIYVPMFDRIFQSNLLPQLLRVMKDSKDSTYIHSLNVAMTAALIGQLLHKSKEEVYELAEMGVYHDLGKLSIPIEILHKPDPLEGKEWQVIKNHPVLGTRILMQMGERRKSIIEGTLYHHERLDGSGYPQGLKGREISEMVQILSVADIYDAITSDRHYKKGKSTIKAAIEIMKETNAGRLNRNITRPFVFFLVQQQVNRQVRLSNGQKGILHKVYQDEPLRPDVEVDQDQIINLRSTPQIELEDIL